MKSLQGTVEAKCPHCSAEPFEAQIWSFIRADADPELRETVLYGELNLLECRECGNFFYYESPVVYFDPDAELLVFLLPQSYEKDAVKWREKMSADFKSLREDLAREMKIDYEPLVLFGPEHLKSLLESSLDDEDENAAIEASAGEMGLRTARLRPCAARSSGYPSCVPYEGEVCDPEAFSGAAIKILASGLLSPKLKKMLADVSADKRLFPKI